MVAPERDTPGTIASTCGSMSGDALYFNGSGVREARTIALNHVDNVLQVFQKTGTVWENYAPESAAPGEPAKPDFVGWTGLLAKGGAVHQKEDAAEAFGFE